DPHLTGGGRGQVDPGSVSGTQHLRGEFSSVEAAVWAVGGEGSPTTQGTGAGKRRAQEDVGRGAPEEPRYWKWYAKKNYKSGASTGTGADNGGGGGVLRAGGLPHPAVIALYLLVSGASPHDGPTTTGAAVAGVVGRTSALRVSADRGAVGRGRLAGGQATDSTTPACGRTARSPESAKAYSTRGFDRSANQSHASRARLDLGLHCRCHRARRRLTDVNDPG